MTDMVYVLDASAVLAAFFEEPGAGSVAEKMSGALFCSVNYSEVVSKLVDRGIPTDQIVEIMGQLDVEVVPADSELAMMAGLLRAKTRTKGLSLGDRYCLALAVSRNAVALTADRAWVDLEIGSPIEVIR